MSFSIRYPTSNVADVGGWTNAANAGADDNTYATAGPAKNATIASRWYNFGFDTIIPASATVNRVTIEVGAFQSGAVDTNYTIGFQPYISGVARAATGVLAIGGGGATTLVSGEATAANLATTESIRAAYWDNITRSELLDANLRVRVRATRGGTNTARTVSLDYVRVTVDWSSATGEARSTMRTFGAVHATLAASARPEGRARTQAFSTVAAPNRAYAASRTSVSAAPTVTHANMRASIGDEEVSGFTAHVTHNTSLGSKGSTSVKASPAAATRQVTARITSRSRTQGSVAISGPTSRETLDGRVEVDTAGAPFAQELSDGRVFFDPDLSDGRVLESADGVISLQPQQSFHNASIGARPKLTGAPWLSLQATMQATVGSSPSAGVIQRRETIVYVTFPTPSLNPTQRQRFRMWLRKVGPGDDPTMAVDLFESGFFRATLLASRTVSSTAGEYVEVPFPASALATSSGANVELKLVGAGELGTAIEVGDIDWLVGQPSQNLWTSARLRGEHFALRPDMTVTITGRDTVARVSFGDPPAPGLIAGVAAQQFAAEVRKKGAGADPQVRIEVWENGVYRATALADTPVTSSTLTSVSGLWDASVLSDLSGAGVECRVVGTGADHGMVEVGAVEWNAAGASAQAGTALISSRARLNPQSAAVLLTGRALVAPPSRLSATPRLLLPGTAPIRSTPKASAAGTAQHLSAVQARSIPLVSGAGTTGQAHPGSATAATRASVKASATVTHAVPVRIASRPATSATSTATKPTSAALRSRSQTSAQGATAHALVAQAAARLTTKASGVATVAALARAQSASQARTSATATVTSTQEAAATIAPRSQARASGVIAHAVVTRAESLSQLVSAGAATAHAAQASASTRPQTKAQGATAHAVTGQVRGLASVKATSQLAGQADGRTRIEPRSQVKASGVIAHAAVTRAASLSQASAKATAAHAPPASVATRSQVSAQPTTAHAVPAQAKSSSSVKATSAVAGQADARSKIEPRSQVKALAKTAATSSPRISSRPTLSATSTLATAYTATARAQGRTSVSATPSVTRAASARVAPKPQSQALPVRERATAAALVGASAQRAVQTTVLAGTAQAASRSRSAAAPAVALTTQVRVASYSRTTGAARLDIPAAARLANRALLSGYSTLVTLESLPSPPERTAHALAEDRVAIAAVEDRVARALAEDRVALST